MEGKVRNSARADSNRKPRPRAEICWLMSLQKKSTVSKKFADHCSQTCVLGPPATHTHMHTYVWFNNFLVQFQLAFPAHTRYTRHPKHNTVHHVVMCARKKHQQAAAQSESELQEGSASPFYPQRGKTNLLSVSYRITQKLLNGFH